MQRMISGKKKNKNMKNLMTPVPQDAVTKKQANQFEARPGPRRGRKSNAIDFADIKGRAEGWIIDILEEIAPEGALQGNEYVLLNPHRNDGDLGSFKYNIDKHVFTDFADDDVKGSDIIGLVAFLDDVNPLVAAKKVSDLIDRLEHGEQPATMVRVKTRIKAKNPKKLTVPVVPVPDGAPQAPDFHYELGAPTATYTYTDADDHLLCYVRRFDLAGQRKEFRPQTYRKSPEGQMGWTWLGLDDHRPLYNLHELVTRPDVPVLIVEGEKAANAAKELFPDRVVVTTMGGAKAPDKTDLTPLRGRSVLIWPDNDEAGKKYVETLTELLRKQDPESDISVMRVPDVEAEVVEGQPVLKPGFIAPRGWDAADAVTKGWTARHIQLLDQVSFEGVEVDTSYRVDEFEVSDDGVFYLKFKDGNEQKIRIASRIDVKAQTRDRSSLEWGIVLDVTDPDGHKHEWALPKQLLTTPSIWRAELLRMGADLVPVGEEDLVHRYLVNAKPRDRALCVTQPGWHQNVFVLPNRPVIGGATPERVILQTSDTESLKLYQHRGTLEEWKQNVGAACAGNSRLIVSVCVALTGPVLHLLGEENGGFHFVGPSSIGKTTAVEVAASVWGNRDYFVRSWRTTDNALESVAARHNDTTLILDELNQVDPAKAGDVAYMLGNGRGKGRSNKTGSARAVSQWRLTYLSNGEQSLAEHMLTGNQRVMAGQEIRLINLPADAGADMGLFENIHTAGSPGVFATLMKATTKEYFGHPGPALVEALADQARQAGLLAEIRAAIAIFMATHVAADASSQVIRVAKRFALIGAVGETATRLGILPWPEGGAIAGARTCLQSWVDGRGGVGNQEPEQAIAQVRRFLELNGESRFTAWDELTDNNAGSKTINRAGFRRLTNDDRTEYYVLPEAYKKDVCSGLNPTQVTSALLERNLLVLSNDGKPQRQERLPGLGSMKVYRIKADILGGAR